jgi:cupin domain
MIPEAPLEATEHGLVCKGDGWFVVNARDVRWRHSPGLGRNSNFGGDTLFDQLGVGITYLDAGEPMTMYHWESDQEGFLVLSGSATLVIEGEDRPLRQWDYVHCPPGAKHVIVGGPCVVFGVGARERHTMLDEAGNRVGRPGESEYVADPVAAKLGGAPPETTEDPRVAYARFPSRTFVRYGGWLD